MSMKIVGAPLMAVHFSLAIAFIVDKVSGNICGKTQLLPLVIDDIIPVVRPNFSKHD